MKIIIGNGVITYTTRELKDEYLGTDDKYKVTPFARTRTWTQPLLFNGYTNFTINHAAQQSGVQSFARSMTSWMTGYFWGW